MLDIGIKLALTLTQIGVIMGIVLLTVALLTLLERKVLGWMQDRMGPMEVGPYGILQPVAEFFDVDIQERISTSSFWEGLAYEGY